MITYDASIHVYSAVRSEGLQIPNLWAEILDGVSVSVVAADVAGLLGLSGRTESTSPPRAPERAAAYEIVADMLRYSMQRGLGWRCDDPFSSGWGIDREMVRPYQQFTMIAEQDLALQPIGLSNTAGFPEGSDQMSDWFFIVGPDGPVCAVDPDHDVMFPDQTHWSLLELATAPSWKIAASIAAKVRAERQGPINWSFGPHPAFAATLEDRQLFAHEALGGRVVDHEIYGPTPVLKGSVRRLMEKASASAVPSHALALGSHQAAAATQILNHENKPDYTTSEAPFNADSVDLVVVWNLFSRRGKRHPAGMIIVVRRSDPAAFGSLDPVLQIATVLGIDSPRLLCLDPQLHSADEPYWRIQRLD